MTHYCRDCDIYWYPYQTKLDQRNKGICPECGGGTVRSNEAGSLDPDARYKAAVARRADEEARAKAHREFERYCERRDRQALEAQLAEIRALEETEPREWRVEGGQEAA
jgi:hypothetical protein